ncbi:FtsX-like permease family protein [Clostridium magnum]|uniref:ABC transporter permease protein YxdM n=1 Tax=Clostridium magnum DSM 2767 TaxID=1121326 RepID=A0A162QHL1_9CLOT|nr:ABC transporter permease [Clostridium magnum]KZL88534.1 ABC transporter permease protein YxdM [Clostridium magnum DSM 2767]SHI14643.1 putative ABC transport system permease protein [Clostridium magnum DSM 2767]
MKFTQFAYKNVSRNIKAYFVYFLSICISSALFFSFTMFLFHPNKGQFKSYIETSILVTEIIAYLFLFFFVFYSVSVFLKSRYKEFGILYIIGISKKQLLNMIFAENIIINSVATLSGIVIGLVFSKIYLVVIKKLFRLTSLSFYFPVKAIVITLLSFILLGVLVSLSTSVIIKEKEVLKLLKATKAPKAEYKASIFLALLGFILLMLGYNLSLTSSKENIDKIILPIVAMIIFATYLLFSQFSVFSMGLLKRNRLFYLKNTNLLLISNLFYKVKDNSRMFFLVAITSSVAFTSIGISYAFWKNTLGNIEKRYPYDFTYTTYSNAAKVKEEISFLEATLKEDKYDYKKVILQKSSYTSKDNDVLTLIKESTYNQLANQLNLKPISVNINEAIKIQDSNANKRTAIELYGSLLTISNKVVNNIIPESYDNIYVVHDMIFDMIEAKNKASTMYTFQVKDWSDTYKVYDKYAEKYGDDKYSLLLSKSHIYETEKRAYGVVMFLSIFVGVIFFVASGSFIYNKFYMDEEIDKKKYAQLNKIGVTYKEIKRVVTLEIGVLFLLPYLVAVIHSTFALTTLKKLFNVNVTEASFLVMGSILLIQILYFLIIRGKYLLEIREQLID